MNSIISISNYKWQMKLNFIQQNISKISWTIFYKNYLWFESNKLIRLNNNLVFRKSKIFFKDYNKNVGLIYKFTLVQQVVYNNKKKLNSYRTSVSHIYQFQFKLHFISIYILASARLIWVQYSPCWNWIQTHMYTYVCMCVVRPYNNWN